MTRIKRCAAPLLALLTLAAVAAAPEASAQAPEFRAQWVDVLHPGYFTADEVTTTVANLRAGNANVMIPGLSTHSDSQWVPDPAFYPNLGGILYANGIPLSVDLASEPQIRRDPNYDALTEILSQAHDTTGNKPRLDVWAWVVAFNSNAVMRAAHPEWLTRQPDQTVVEQYFDPGHPGAVQQLYNVCMDLVANHEIDGLQFDYIRYMAADNGFNPVSVARFNALSGRTGVPPANDAQFAQWRRDQVTNLVRKVYLNALDRKPALKVSAALIAASGAPLAPEAADPNPTQTWKEHFRSSHAYLDFYQDWRSWMEEGILDIGIPMDYFHRCFQQEVFENWVNFTAENAFERQVMIGTGVFVNTLPDALYQLHRTRDASRLAGKMADGQCLFSYASPYAETCGGTVIPRPDEMASALVTGKMLDGTVVDGTPLYPSRVGLPAIKRLTNGMGHLKGTITASGALSPGWIDGAVVTASGPVTRRIRSDGTGFYGFVDLPPGVYSVTARATGCSHVTKSATIAAGQVTTLDLTLPTAGAQDQLAFTIQPGGGIAGRPLTSQPVVVAKDPAGNTLSGFSGNMTLSIKAWTGAADASLAGTATVKAVNGVATFTDVTIGAAGTGYILTAEAEGIDHAESAAFDVVPPVVPVTTTYRATPIVVNGDWQISGFGVNDNPNSPYYGWLYVTDRTAGVHRVRILRPNPATAGTAASAWEDTGKSIRASGSSNTPWDVAIGPDDTVWIADLGAKNIDTAPPVPAGDATEVTSVKQIDTDALFNTGGPRGVAVSGNITDAYVCVCFTSPNSGAAFRVSAPDPLTAGTASFHYGGPMSISSGPYGAGLGPDLTAYLALPMNQGATAKAFYAVRFDKQMYSTGAMPPWVNATTSMTLQDASFGPDAAANGGGCLYHSSRVSSGGQSRVAVHRFAMDGTWIDGFGLSVPNAPPQYTILDIPTSTVSTVAYHDTDDRGNVYVLGMQGGANAIFKVSRVPVTSLAFSTEPGGAAMNAPLSPQPVVTVRDADGNPVTSFSGNVMLELSGGTAGAALLGTKMVAAVKGVARFEGLSVDTPGTGYTLTALAEGYPAATSGAFSIGQAPYTGLEALRALRIAAGLDAAFPKDIARLDAVLAATSAGSLDIRDATRIIRKAAGLEPNP